MSITRNKITTKSIQLDSKYYWLDFIRGVSALAVFSGHLRIICFTDKDIQQLPFFGKVIFFLTGFGHEAVMIFFVLSGFFIIKSIHEGLHKNQWSFTNYANNRIIRLWVVLLPALIFGFLLDKMGLTYFPDSLGYSNQIRYFQALNLESVLRISIFFGNLFFLQTILVPTLGSNGSLWSLANEFWYYVVFPLLYFSASRHYSIIIRVTLGLIGLSILVVIGISFTLFFIIWLMGGVSYIMLKLKSKGYFTHKTMLPASLTLFLVTLLMVRLKLMPHFFNDYTLGLIFAFLVPSLTEASMPSVPLKKIATYLSDISYTLYLVHLPFNFFITACFYFQGKSWGATNFLIFAGLTILTILYATLMWYLFERNTAILKKWLLNSSGAIYSKLVGK